MKIGNVEITGFAALAPMAGVADRAMREICRKTGAAYCVGELTSAKGISLGDNKSRTLICCTQNEKPMAAQIFGSDVDAMRAAAVACKEMGADIVDINMGCPAPKVAGNGGGSALMKNPALAQKITAACVKAVDIPVTVKMRSGWDDSSINAVELAKMVEYAGAAAVTVHGRTRRQMYAPPVNLDIIKEVKQAVKIPVIGNGDVVDGASAKFMYDYTGCDLVMVGRAAEGNPFVFGEINAYLSGKSYTPPTLEERLNMLKEQVKLMVQYKGEYVAMREARKHTSWYLKGFRGAAAMRKMCAEIIGFDDIEQIIEKALEENL